MKLVIQRVLEASVEVEATLISQIESGLLVLVGFEEGDGAKEMESALSKLRWGRFFENEEGRPHYSAFDLQKPLLVVSQFTLCADLKQGRRPDFSQAMKANSALESFNLFVEMLKSSGLEVFCGQFGAYMKVSLVNDGPFTLVWSSN